MPDVEYGRRLSVKENAMPALSQIRDQLSDAVIAIVDHPPESCCQIGFHAVPVSRDELPENKFNKIGMIEELEVAAEIGLLPSDDINIVLGFDRESGTLVAYVDQ